MRGAEEGGGVPGDHLQRDLFCYTQAGAVPLQFSPPLHPGATEVSAETQGPLKGEGGYRGAGWVIATVSQHLLPLPQCSPPPPPASPPCNRVGVRGAMRNGQTPGDTAGFPLTPRGTHVYLEPGQMRTSLLLASFYPQTDKDGQGK